MATLVSNGATIASTMFHVKVNRDEPVDLHDQVAAEIRRAIADGEAKQGERLPLPRLAAVLGVNTNTVLRAHAAVAGRRPARVPPRPRGDSVIGTPERGAVVDARRSVHFARQQGYPLDELVRIIEEVG